MTLVQRSKRREYLDYLQRIINKIAACLSFAERAERFFSEKSSELASSSSVLASSGIPLEPSKRNSSSSSSSTVVRVALRVALARVLDTGDIDEDIPLGSKLFMLTRYVRLYSPVNFNDRRRIPRLKEETK